MESPKHGDIGVVDTVKGLFNNQRHLGESYTALLEDPELGSSSSETCSDIPLDDVEEKQLPLAKRRWSCAGRYGAKDAGRLVQRVFWTLMPSFVAHAFGQGDEDSVIPQPSSTSYLNGLRGIASLIVAFFHNTDDYFFFVRRGYGQQPGDHHLIQLPFVRLLVSGVYMVAIFFVISGFALTYGPLKKTYSGPDGPEKAIASLPSSVFRRAFRLFIPIVPVLIATDFLIRIRWFYVMGGSDPVQPMPGGLWEYAVHVWHSLIVIVTEGRTDTILPQGWTLAAEYQGSLIVFLTCLALARVSPYVRIPCVAAMMVFVMCVVGQWQQSLFLAGMLLADARHLRAKFPALEGKARAAVAVVSWLVVLLALLMGGFPVSGNGFEATGFRHLAWVPTFGVKEVWNFFESVAAVMLVAALENLPVLQRVLNCRPVLYLGEISYGLYLVHWAVGKNLLTKGLSVHLLRSGHDALFSWAAGFAVTMSLAIWIADIHWRLCDQKSVQFAHWLSKKFGI
ncbi:hypothetical protein CTRI78_v002656 [Colletotrichum trifolii]|uniref:Acyltransferase 3 domain-containing protein n=1 Tax=Colletotrichum trifolii TaxID=5466 RepID=A0A4R8RPR4_COLTR|nr:hypothetical protein CTRI78_v002656 [Colletotrichum trifolii]